MSKLKAQHGAVLQTGMIAIKDMLEPIFHPDPRPAMDGN
jgi:hypothetical protein